MLKTCLTCQCSFESKTKRATCSDACWVANKKKYRDAWNVNNPEKKRATQQRTRKTRQANGKFHEYQRLRRSSKAGYLDRFLERARNMHPNTDLTREYLESIFTEKCAITGVPFKYERKGKTSFENPYSPSIDRIDSKLPYQIGNIQIVLSTVNFAKNAASMTDFTKVWQDIAKSWAALTQGAY